MQRFSGRSILFFYEKYSRVDSIEKLLRVSDDFPVHQSASRSTETKRNIYFLSESARDMINNEKKIKVSFRLSQTEVKPRFLPCLQFINAEVRMFCRAGDKVADCIYRIAQEGLPSISTLLSPEILILSRRYYHLCGSID